MEGVYCFSESRNRKKGVIPQDFFVDKHFIENYLECSCLSCNFAAARQILFYSLLCWLMAALLMSLLIPAAAQTSGTERYGSLFQNLDSKLHPSVLQWTRVCFLS